MTDEEIWLQGYIGALSNKSMADAARYYADDCLKHFKQRFPDYDMRKHNPALLDAWNAYQTLLALYKTEQIEKNNENKR